MRPHRPARGESRSPRNGRRPCPRRNGTPTVDDCGPAACWRPRRRPRRVHAGRPGHLGPVQVFVQVDRIVLQPHRWCSFSGVSTSLYPAGQQGHRRAILAKDIRNRSHRRSRMHRSRRLSACAYAGWASRCTAASRPAVSRFTPHLARSTIPRRSILHITAGTRRSDRFRNSRSEPPDGRDRRQLRARSIKSQWCRRAAPNGRRWLTLPIGDAVKLAKLKAGRTTKTDWRIGRRTTIA